MNTTLSALKEPSLPWWKYPHMWLVVGGPLIVVIASFVTFGLVVRTADPVYSDKPGGLTYANYAQAAALTRAKQEREHVVPAGLAHERRAASAAADGASGKTPE